VCFICVANLALLNLVTGVVVDQVLAVSRKMPPPSHEAQEEHLTHFRGQLEILFKQADKDRSGTLSQDEQVQLLKACDTQKVLYKLGVGLPLHKDQFLMVLDDDEASGSSTFNVWWEGLRRLRGTRHDHLSGGLQYEFRVLNRQLNSKICDAERRLCWSSSATTRNSCVHIHKRTAHAALTAHRHQTVAVVGEQSSEPASSREQENEEEKEAKALLQVNSACQHLDHLLQQFRACTARALGTAKQASLPQEPLRNPPSTVERVPVALQTDSPEPKLSSDLSDQSVLSEEPFQVPPTSAQRTPGAAFAAEAASSEATEERIPAASVEVTPGNHAIADGASLSMPRQVGSPRKPCMQRPAEEISRRRQCLDTFRGRPRAPQQEKPKSPTHRQDSDAFLARLAKGTLLPRDVERLDAIQHRDQSTVVIGIQDSCSPFGSTVEIPVCVDADLGGNSDFIDRLRKGWLLDSDIERLALIPPCSNECWEDPDWQQHRSPKCRGSDLAQLLFDSPDIYRDEDLLVSREPLSLTRRMRQMARSLSPRRVSPSRSSPRRRLFRSTVQL